MTGSRISSTLRRPTSTWAVSTTGTWTSNSPGVDPIDSHAGFIGWYENLLGQTLWNFHEIHAIQIKRTTPQEYLVTFVVNWYGEVKPDSDQLAGWQSRSDSFLYHHFIRQTWTMSVGGRLVIRKLVAAAGDTPSPIAE
jgi:hypothetical protein